MMSGNLNFEISRLGECTVPSPMRNVRFTGDDEHILFHSDLSEIRQLP